MCYEFTTRVYLGMVWSGFLLSTPVATAKSKKMQGLKTRVGRRGLRLKQACRFSYGFETP